ncbi:SPASM domain-containing protein, partial [archaeon]|nr:SPASM domain-containing protein [archaeon]
KEVKAIADKYKLNLTPTIYETPVFFKTSLPRRNQIYETEDIIGKNKFLKCYNRWSNGKLYLPCNSIRINFVVWPNGKVGLCQQKNVILGDLNRNTVTEIWNSESTKKLQKSYRTCNGCWFFAQRTVDTQIYGALLK